MSMSRKDYVMIAEVIATARDAADDDDAEAELCAIVAVAHELAAAFEADNPAFARNRFLTACGV